MMRISNPEKSLDFYTRILGMTLVEKYDFEGARFSLYFLLQCNPAEVPEDPKERKLWLMTQPGSLELTQSVVCFLLSLLSLSLFSFLHSFCGGVGSHTHTATGTGIPRATTTRGSDTSVSTSPTCTRRVSALRGRESSSARNLMRVSFHLHPLPLSLS